MSAYVYRESKLGTGDGRGLWTVGFFTPAGEWEPESDHVSEAAAAKRVHWLNGGQEWPTDAERQAAWLACQADREAIATGKEKGEEN